MKVAFRLLVILWLFLVVGLLLGMLADVVPALDSDWFRVPVAVVLGLLWARFDERVLARIAVACVPLRQWIARRTVCRKGCKGLQVVRERKLSGVRTILFFGLFPVEVEDVEVLVACPRCGGTKQVNITKGSTKNGKRHGTD